MKKVYLVGVGMGNPSTLTLGAQQAVAESQLAIGAQRLVDAFPEFAGERRVLIKSADIAAAIHESTAETISVLLSGDQGFYSGAAGLYNLLADCDVEALPGISSPVYFAAKLKKSWQDAYLVSAHGRACNVVGAVQSHAKTFALTGGNAKVHEICQQLVDRGLGHLRAYAGERLSYPDERIVSGTVADLATQQFLDLAVLWVENDAPSALAAVGATTTLCWLITETILGLSVGTSVRVANAFGAGRGDEVSDTVHTSILLGLILGVLAAIVFPLLMIAGLVVLRKKYWSEKR